MRLLPKEKINKVGTRLSMIIILICLMLSIVLSSVFYPVAAKVIDLPKIGSLLESGVKETDLIVVGIIIDEKDQTVTSTSPIGQITYNPMSLYTLSIEKIIKGDLNSREGSRLPEIQFQSPPMFNTSERIMVFLDKTTISPYQYRPIMRGGLGWAEGKGTKEAELRELNEIICMVIKLMRKNNIPVALAPDQIPCPPLPVTERIYIFMTTRWWIIVAVLVVFGATSSYLILGNKHYKKHLTQ